MLDPDLLYIKARQRELWQKAAEHALAQRCTVDKPRWRERWRRYLEAFLTAPGRWVPVRSTTRLVPAVVRLAPRRGGNNLWPHR